MFRKALDRVIIACTVIGGLALLLMMLHITIDVIGKFFFNTPVPGTIEVVSTYYMVAVAFLPLAMVERKNAHIAVELVSQHLSEYPYRLLMVVVSFAGMLYFAAFTWRTAEDAWDKLLLREYLVGDVPVVVWPTRFFIPIGCGLIALLLLYKAVQLLRGDLSVIEERMPIRGEE